MNKNQNSCFDFDDDGDDQSNDHSFGRPPGRSRPQILDLCLGSPLNWTCLGQIRRESFGGILTKWANHQLWVFSLRSSSSCFFFKMCINEGSEREDGSMYWPNPEWRLWGSRFRRTENSFSISLHNKLFFYVRMNQFSFRTCHCSTNVSKGGTLQVQERGQKRNI